MSTGRLSGEILSLGHTVTWRDIVTFKRRSGRPVDTMKRYSEIQLPTHDVCYRETGRRKQEVEHTVAESRPCICQPTSFVCRTGKSRYTATCSFFHAKPPGTVQNFTPAEYAPFCSRSLVQPSAHSPSPQTCRVLTSEPLHITPMKPAAMPQVQIFRPFLTLWPVRFSSPSEKSSSESHQSHISSKAAIALTAAHLPVSIAPWTLVLT